MSVSARLVSRLRRAARFLPRPTAPPLPAGWLPITQTEPTDIFIVAYPKSGSTWFQALLAGVLYGLDPAQAPDRLTQDLVPDVHYKACYKRYRSPMCFKSHHLPQPGYRRVVYLVRDGRDVLVSFRHHVEAIQRRPVEFAEFLDGTEHFPCSWQAHVAQWLANPYAAELLVIRYEDLHKAPVHELTRFCTFAGEARDPAELARIAERCAFAAMQQRERRFGWDNSAWPADRPFVRRGVVGSHCDELPAAVASRFTAEAQKVLHWCGYTAALSGGR